MTTGRRHELLVVDLGGGGSNVPTALFSNNGPMIDLCLQGPLNDLARHFDTIICSWHIAAVKPTPEAFDRAANRLGYQPQDLLLLDDSHDNVIGARNAGWNAELVRTDLDLQGVRSTLG